KPQSKAVSVLDRDPRSIGVRIEGLRNAEANAGYVNVFETGARVLARLVHPGHGPGVAVLAASVVRGVRGSVRREAFDAAADALVSELVRGQQVGCIEIHGEAAA